MLICRMSCIVFINNYVGSYSIINHKKIDHYHDTAINIIKHFHNSITPGTHYTVHALVSTNFVIFMKRPNVIIKYFKESKGNLQRHTSDMQLW